MREGDEGRRSFHGGQKTGRPKWPGPCRRDPGSLWEACHGRFVSEAATATLYAPGDARRRLVAGANASTLLYAAGHPVDRMNIPDTLKAQMSACVRPPMVLMSDRGLALASVLASSLDWHDALSGHSVDEDVVRFGPTSYGADRNAWRRSARAGLLSELRKHGRDEADLHACVNFFSKVSIGDEVTAPLAIAEPHCAEGDFVTLRIEQDVLLVLSTAPHPLATTWAPAAVLVTVAPADPLADEVVGAKPSCVMERR